MTRVAISIGRGSSDAKSRGLAADCVPVEATDPLYILYTSGSTGTPKGVVRDNGGHMVALVWTMKNLYGVKPGEVFWSASDIGWVVGHSYIVYGPLLAGNATVSLRRQAGRNARRRRLLARSQASTRFCPLHRADGAPRDQEGRPRTAPTSATMTLRPSARCSWRASAPIRYRALGRGAPEGSRDRPLVADGDGLGHCGNPIGLGQLPSSAARPCLPMPGYDVGVLDDGGHPVATASRQYRHQAAASARLLCRPLWNADARFGPSYLVEFPGYYKTADAGYIDADGYLSVMGRTDDIINVAGHRLSTGAMEEVLASTTTWPNAP